MRAGLPAHIATLLLTRADCVRCGPRPCFCHQTFGHTAAVPLVALREVRNHPLLYVAVALPDEVDEVVDQFVTLPVFHRAVARACLAIVVLPPDLLSHDVAGGERRVMFARALGLAQRVCFARRLVINMRVLAGL